ncbi:MAG: glycine cleavage system protein GcvH [Candidatus Marinimicrobia bacterium]|jgi:glycine cleavage system H protein|nr:glycine cleavage system protein GcvH [Candidatus Neomarinimicrobiota bacterium]MDD4961127.1 glycine cleavage system protein GcvH [Candidatus Neomarinimicrobiota bacterium]MDD5709356.1 glycine cleavage system protein GcvH [Candidatus Neomarinimicrobiota bacterium]MDX9778427.1 glycine cleavage system protein GcvH [bacterium]
MKIPKDLKYAQSHEWVKVDGDIATVGISDFAQGELGDIVFVDLPEVGSSTVQGEACGTIEAVKTVSDMNAPVSGEVIEVNEGIEEEPTLVNSDCYGRGWIMKIRISDKSELDELMDADAYRDFSD